MRSFLSDCPLQISSSHLSEECSTAGRRGRRKLFPCPSFPSHGSVKSQCLLRTMAVCKKKKKKSGKDTLYQLKVPNTWSPCGRGDHLTPACVQSCVRLFATPWTIEPSSLLCPTRFSRQEYWSGCHALPQGIFLTQGSSPRLSRLLHSQVGSSPLAPPGKPWMDKHGTNRSAAVSKWQGWERS